MQVFHIETVPGFEQWRCYAREALQSGISPKEILWRSAASERLLDLSLGLLATPQPKPASTVSVSKAFIELAQIAACHQSPDRYAQLYRVLWRLTHENKKLLHYQTDPDVMQLNTYAKAVRRDAYKTKAFLRFRELINPNDSKDSEFIAWYEPEHYSLELTLPFFQARFKNMRWSILTPYRAAYWDKEILSLAENPDPSQYPNEDQVEQYWLTYYASIFNPARVKKQAMLNQMPKKYWKNMPETVLIDALLKNANETVNTMLTKNKF